MRDIVVFAEDFGHEKIVGSIIARLCRDSQIEHETNMRSVRGGHGTALTELSEFMRDLEGDRTHLPDLVVVALDSNCKGLAEKRKAIVQNVPEEFRDFVVTAVPDPHVERWMLLDSAAFKAVFGQGCDAPDAKCDRDRYKRLLAEAIENSGTYATLGGMEFADEIVAAMDLQTVGRDTSFGDFLAQLRHKINQWRAAR
jgi:hypothetical protein